MTMSVFLTLPTLQCFIITSHWGCVLVLLKLFWTTFVVITKSLGFTYFFFFRRRRRFRRFLIIFFIGRFLIRRFLAILGLLIFGGLTIFRRFFAIFAVFFRFLAVFIFLFSFNNQRGNLQNV